LLHFITGRAGSGKTVYARNHLAQLTKCGKEGLILIVPEQFSFESERAMLSLLGPAGANKVDIFSFTRLAEHVFSALGNKLKNPVDKCGKIILISLALEGVQDKLLMYKRCAQNISMATNLLNMFTEFKQANISPADLNSASDKMDESALRQKLYELSLIMSAYDALLHEKFSDDLDVLPMLKSALQSNHFFKGKTVVIDAFKGFTAQEFDIISLIMVQAEDVYITLTTDDIFGSLDETCLFSCVNQTAKKLLYLAKQNNIKISTQIKLPLNGKHTRFKNDELAYLEQNMFNPCAQSFDDPADNITVFSAADKSEECDFIAAYAKKLMRLKGYMCRDIAVITRDSAQYKRDLLSSFKKYSIPVFEDDRQPITSQPLITFVCCALEIAVHGLSTDRLMRCLKTGLTDISDEEIAIAENYALMWKIGAGGWKNKWTQHPGGFGLEMNDSAMDALNELNDIRERMISPLLKFKSKCGNSSGQEKAGALYDLLTQVNSAGKLKELALLFLKNGSTSLAMEQDRIWSILMDVLDTISDTLGKRTVTASRFSDLFNSVISVVDIGSIPQGIDEIIIGTADRVRLSSPKAVFIAGANEGVFPQYPPTGGILTDADRRRLIDMELYVSEPSEYRSSQERFTVYNCVSSASQCLIITYSKSSPLGEAMHPSVIATEIMETFPQCTFLDSDTLPPEYLIESYESAFEACAKVYRTDTALSAALKDLLSGYKTGSKYAALKRVSDVKPFKIEDPKTALALFGKNIYMSASKVEVYHKCPFEYFCRYGLFAKPKKAAALDALQSGTIIHYVLENLVKTYGKNGLLLLDDAQKSDVITQILTTYLNERMGGLRDKPKRFEYQFFRLKRTVTEIVDRLCREFESSQFSPVSFELKIGNDGEIKPYSLSLPNGGTLKVIGSVDRVDIYQKDDKSYIRVVDYKSGAKDFKLSDVLYGLNMQMLIYLFAIAKNGSELYGEIIPTGVLYYPAKMSISKLPRTAQNDDLAMDKIKKGKGAGILIDDMDAVSAMEDSLSGLFIPAYASKSGGLTGSLISISKLGELNRRIDNTLIDMATSLQCGLIPAVPAVGKDYQNTCRYCDYKSICNYEITHPSREIKNFIHSDALDLLNGGDEDEYDLDK
jgi:ATP-dependent helicase/nuclease subunit B